MPPATGSSGGSNGISASRATRSSSARRCCLRKAALAADADALAVEGSDGWLVVSQRAEGRFLAGFASPGRALVYTTGARPDAPAEAYTELEFVALGPRAAHEIVFRILPPGVSPWDAE